MPLNRKKTPDAQTPAENQKRKKSGRTYWILLFLVIVALAAVILALQIIGMDPAVFAARFKNSPAAIPALAGLYLIKAATVVLLPQPLLYLLTGLLFSPLAAFLLTLAFLLMEFSLDYFIGRHFGKKWLDKLLRFLRGRNRILDRLLDADALDRFGSIAALRLMPGISTDSVSLLAGAMNVKFSRYLFASYIGALPQAVTLTLMGSSAHDPLSPRFLIPMGIFLLALLITFLLYRFFNKRARAEEKPLRVVTTTSYTLASNGRGCAEEKGNAQKTAISPQPRETHPAEALPRNTSPTEKMERPQNAARKEP